MGMTGVSIYTMNQETKICQNCKNQFVIEPEDFLFYDKMKVPPPTWCPECRMVRRMTWRNESALYRRQCGLCKKSIITIYAKESPFTVYCRECWISDQWDARSYGKEYDWSTNFFTQFRKCMESVPLVLVDSKGTMIDSEYGNYNANCKNCYLCFSTALSEDSLYCSYSQDLKQCLDSTRLRGGELCYEAIDSEKDYSCAFINRTRESVDSSFLFECSGVTNCFMSANVRHKSYVFRERYLSVEDYRSEIKNIDLGSFRQVQNLEEEFTKLKASVLHKYTEIKNSVKATGNNITNSKQVQYSFDVIDSEDVKYSIRVFKGCRDIYDCHGVLSGELVYEGFGCGILPRNNLFSFSIDVSRDLAYCAMCRDCVSCFGCVGLRNKQYCILNQQYTKEAYEELVPKIIQHMNDMPYTDKKGRVYQYGEFFPPELSPFSYNETIAQEYFPLTQEQALEKGYRWKNPETKNYNIQIPNNKLPDNIKDVQDDIINQIIECAHQGQCTEQCTTAFKIINQELAFYRQMNLPLPRLCPNCRHYQRLKQRNPLKLWHRSCQCSGEKSSNGVYQNTVSHSHGNNPCPTEFETSYAPERPEIVYCEQCYQAEVV